MLRYKAVLFDMLQPQLFITYLQYFLYNEKITQNTGKGMRVVLKQSLKQNKSSLFKKPLS